jgi:low temperature requirement protein LtrA
MTSPNLLRVRGQKGSGRVTNSELFFDLVFVFAITQLSHALLGDLRGLTAVRLAVLLPAVWWVWIYTSWTTNWLDPDRLPMRICLFMLMICGLVLASAIPHAFDSRGLVFACAYIAMQLGRTLFVLWSVRAAKESMRRNFQRVFVWLVYGAIFWLIGGLTDVSTRAAWWALALMAELIGPAVFFWVPGLGRSSIADWDIDGGHMAERCSLFVIIALGESLLVTGATFALERWSTESILAMLIAVLSTIAMWWIYFDTGAERAQERIVNASDPGRQARIGYTYLHLLIVAGIILSAVGDELVLAHPHHMMEFGAVVLLLGPAIYIVGVALFKWVTSDRRAPPLSHVVGITLLAALSALTFYDSLSPIITATVSAAVLVLTATWEAIALRSVKAPLSHPRAANAR